jgi:histidinol-phosphate phosphatase family protein
MSRAAVFLDRDGTLVDDPGFLADPASVRLLPGAAEALARLGTLGLVRVVISNQSGIARGRITLAEADAVQAEVRRQIEAGGGGLEECLRCPHAPEDGCTCRKPGTALHREAAGRLDLDCTRSWFVGDRISDLLPVRELGGRAILVRTGDGASHEAEAHGLGAAVVDDLMAAAALIGRT